jgi:alpha-glucosidase
MLQLGVEISREMRAAIKAECPDAYLIGEHFYDGTPAVQGDQLDGVMNYTGFHFPVRRWLTGLPSDALAEQMTAFLAAIPWVIGAQQFNLLGSHDTSRIKTFLSGDDRLLKLAATLLMTFPGVPCVYYGDEIGIEGGDDPDNRRCMIWDESAWDADLRAHYQKLIRLRRESSALREGGLQWLFAEGDVIAFQRQSPQQRMIVIGNRGDSDFADFALPVWHSGLAEGAHLQDVFSGKTYPVEGGSIHLKDLGAACILVEA